MHTHACRVLLVGRLAHAGTPVWEADTQAKATWWPFPRKCPPPPQKRLGARSCRCPGLHDVRVHVHARGGLRLVNHAAVLLSHNAPLCPPTSTCCPFSPPIKHSGFFQFGCYILPCSCMQEQGVPRPDRWGTLTS